MADVLLVCPNISDIDADNRTFLNMPFGLLTISAWLMKEGYTTKILDQRVETKEDFEQEFSNELKKEPFAVGMTAMTGRQCYYALQASKFAKAHNPNILTLWGGVHPSLEQDTTLDPPEVDILAVGEADSTIPTLIKAIEDGKVEVGNLDHIQTIPGFAWKTAGTLQYSLPALRIDLNTIPLIPYTLVDFEKYRRDLSYFNFTGSVAIPVETSRGCSHRCTFCAESKQPHAWVAQTAERVLDSLRHVAETCHGEHSIQFTDDNFFVVKKRNERIAQMIIDEKLDVEWYCNVRPEYFRKMDIPFLKMIERSGCRSVTLGMESGSDRMLQRIDKGATAEDMIVANRKLAHTNIKGLYCTIAGLPYETMDDIKKTYRLVMQIVDENPNARPGIVNLIPTPNTKIFDECVEKGFRRPQTLEEWSNVFGMNTMPWVEPEVNEFILKNRLLCDLLYRKYEGGRVADMAYKLYAAFFRWRMRHDFYGLHLESTLRDTLKTFKGTLEAN